MYRFNLKTMPFLEDASPDRLDQINIKKHELNFNIPII